MTLIVLTGTTFVLNGTVNKQNCRYWSTEYPHWMVEANTQYPEKVNVLAGIINSQIIGPYFFDGTLTGAHYLDFLQNFLVPTVPNTVPRPGLLVNQGSANRPASLDPRRRAS
ncbi:hypothetical protein NQ318_019664 [Aromia moschata]|uniref:Uncharacterized protein n=1 Tax=Aromia moschata TaxID=1265417 RepID=A0AAV8Z675_9CUCU|nr:hypothetical protein NQ318_019664 [Aromia moschata]